MQVSTFITLMSNQTGWTITSVYLFLAVAIIIAKIVLRYVYKK